jgi:branched-chain amino acid transport system permease protein
MGIIPQRRQPVGDHMDYAAQQLLNGITLGSVYALIALGYTMVYGVLGMINFAHGEVYMVGAFTSVLLYLVCLSLGLSFVPLILFLVLLGAVTITGCYGYAIEKLAYRPLRAAPRLAPIISAIGLSILLQNFVQLTQGARVKTVPPLFQGQITLWQSADGFAVTLSMQQIFIIVFTIILMLLLTFLIQKTPLGRAQRATAEDRKMAALLGIPTDKIISITFILGAALAAIAGMMVTMYYGIVDFYMGFLAGMKAFTAAVLGGIGSLPGALLGGLLIGLIESFWSGYFNAAYKDVAVFAVLILVLLIRPNGLLAKPEIEKV